MSERDIPVCLIDANPFQTRQIFDEEGIAGLAATIDGVGLLNRILVRPHPDVPGRFQLVHGERRLRACKRLGWDSIPAVVKEVGDEYVADVTLVENLQREDLNPIEEAEGFRRLVDAFGYTAGTLAKRIGKSRSYVANSLRLLTMSFFLRACVLCKTLTAWHARTIMGLPAGYEPYRVADAVMDWGLSVEETRSIVRDVKHGRTWVSWVRDVPISGLEELGSVRDSLPKKSDDELRSLRHSMETVGQIEPIIVLVTGVIVDGHYRVDVARRLGWSTITAEIMFNVDWFRRSESGILRMGPFDGESPPPRGIFPETSDGQLARIRNLNDMLRRGEVVHEVVGVTCE